jgi:hypothetical protein
MGVCVEACDRRDRPGSAGSVGAINAGSTPNPAALCGVGRVASSGILL